MCPAHGLFLRPTLTVAPASQSGFNVRTAAGSIGPGTDVQVVVAAGVVLSGSVLTGTSWPADCSITFDITGIIGAPGGAGAPGANGGTNGVIGQAGGHGVIIQDNVRTYFRIRGSGFIAGGGGGGGGGAAGDGLTGQTYGGGGGGGGQGYPGGAHGNGGVGNSATGGNGQDGSTSAPGGGGPGYGGGNGGAGGGLAGEAWPGSPTATHTVWPYGAAAGSAIYSTGYTPPQILEGHDSAHIKGNVTT